MCILYKWKKNVTYLWTSPASNQCEVRACVWCTWNNKYNLLKRHANKTFWHLNTQTLKSHARECHFSLSFVYDSSHLFMFYIVLFAQQKKIVMCKIRVHTFCIIFSIWLIAFDKHHSLSHLARFSIRNC